MHKISLSPKASSLNATLSVPGSKSYTNRALLTASLAAGISRLSRVSMSSDSDAMIKALRLLGVSIHETADPDGAPALLVEGCGGKFSPFRGTIDVGPAGTTMRFLVALCASIRGAQITLQGSERMHERPIKGLVDALHASGASISYLGRDGCPPLLIDSVGELPGGTVQIDGTLSSQFVSALLLSASLRTDALTIEVIGDQTSRSYIDMTIQGLHDFGIAVENRSYRAYHIAAGLRPNPCHYTIEGDASGASYLWGLAAVSGGTVTVTNVNPASAQGDIKFPEILRMMGCEVSTSSRSITVTGPQQLRAVNVDMSLMPDTAQTLAVIAACAHGTTTITGLHTLRVKETDRLAALNTELAKIGIRSEIADDSITILGGDPQHGSISTYDDHRMAMSFALLGARAPGITIESPDVVEKSFKPFWELLQTAGISLRSSEQ
jgi:3-phosphoshikimate 1-carboxyvinyltransferase